MRPSRRLSVRSKSKIRSKIYSWDYLRIAPPIRRVHCEWVSSLMESQVSPGVYTERIGNYKSLCIGANNQQP
jgi:hypothetical protein